MRLLLLAFPMIVLLASSCAGREAITTEYLSDLPQCLTFHQQGWGELGINTCAFAAGQTPVKLRIKDTEYANGLGHHAPGEIILDLGGQYETFECEVGVQQLDQNVGSVVFQVFVDGKKRFDSGLMRASDTARPVKVSLKGADELRLVVTDGGDGITCDCADWVNARLTRAAGAKARPLPEPFDIAPFARVVTSDPSRMDGCRANRVQEFHAEDLFMETELRPTADGTYAVPVAESGAGCIGLQWIERRRLRDIGLYLARADGASPDGVRVQAWVGESTWQGQWKELKGQIEPGAAGWAFRIDTTANPDIRDGTRKIRWVFPKAKVAPTISKLWANTVSAYTTADVVARMDDPAQGQSAEVRIYNGTIIGDSGDVLQRTWNTAQPLNIKVRYSRTAVWKSDRTVLRFTLPSGSFGVAVDDLIANDCVYVKEAGLFAAKEPAKITLAECKRRVARQKTILQRVEEMPDHTLAQAMAKTRNPIQDSGPVMLSLACDNRKFVLQREGSLQFEQRPEEDERIATHPLQASCRMDPAFGTGKAAWAGRKLDRWVPEPYITYKEGDVTYTQRTCVVPSDQDNPSDLRWLSRKPLCISEFRIENPSKAAAEVSLRLAFMRDSENNKPAEVRAVDSGFAVEGNGRVLALIDTCGAAPLRARIDGGALVVSGSLPAGSAAFCAVSIPGWAVKPGDAGQLTGSWKASARLDDYWGYILSRSARIDVPDPLLSNVIKASQVHCLMAARNEANGARVAPWIASMVYGPLESECNSIIRGMLMLGHEDFARRCLDYYIHRYDPACFLTTGYTLMGTGWHLWTLGEYVALSGDTGWMRSVAPKVEKVCDWIVRQREKTMKLDSRGRKMPEYGLMPPGVLADWNVFSYHFSLNGYYYAGLEQAAEALATIGDPKAQSLLAAANDFRGEILRAYSWTRSLMPVRPLVLRHAQDGGVWVTGYPGQLYAPGPTNDFFPGEDANRSWAYDVELGAHQLVPQGVLDPHSPEVDRMMDHMEDVQFLASGWFDYPAERNETDWFNYGGFAKVQPYYCRNAEIYAMRDDVKPFIRSYFNSLAAMLNTEVLSFWEHFHSSGAWNKTHETGYFLQQTRFMMVMERATGGSDTPVGLPAAKGGDALWLAPFVTNNWMKDGMTVSAAKVPTRFGPVSYWITSHAGQGYIEARIDPPTRSTPSEIVIRLRHPEGRRMRRVTVNGAPTNDFDADREIVRIRPTDGRIAVRAEY